MYCVLADRLDCAEALLKAGADVNRADRSRRTALHLAAQKVIVLSHCMACGIHSRCKGDFLVLNKHAYLQRLSLF